MLRNVHLFKKMGRVKCGLNFFFSHDTTMYSLNITLAIMLCPAHGVDNSNKCLDGQTDENMQEK